MTKVCRGVRGATTANSNSEQDILEATTQLLALMIRKNDMRSQDVVSAIFTSTSDLNATFPAVAARRLGWLDVPLLCMHEVDVPGSLAKCVRILLHWNTEKDQASIEHIYIKDAVRLRPKLSVKLSPEDLAELENWIESYMQSVSDD